MRTSVHSTLVAGVALIAMCLASVPAYAQETEPATPTAFSIVPKGYVQFDVRAFPGWDEVSGTGDLNRSELEMRRLRAGLDGRWRRWSWELTVDPLDEDGTFVKDAYLDTRLTNEFRVRAGQFKVPSSREYLLSGRDTDFLERTAAASSIAAGRDIGVMLLGRAGRSVRYRGGLFAGDGTGRDGRAALTSAGRVVWEPFRGLEIGGSITEGGLQAVDTEPENGLDGRSPSGYRFFDEIYVHGRRLRVGADVEWKPGPWQFVAEALRARDERREQGLDFENLPAVVGNGWSASVLRRFGVKRDAPDRQWHLGVRFEHLGFDDVGPTTGADSVRSRATDIRARAVQVLTAGASWSAARWMRLIANAGFERYAEERSAPDAGTRHYFTMGARIQLQLP